MSLRIVIGLDDSGRSVAVMYDSVTGWAFGPVASEGTIDTFLDWLDDHGIPDARSLTNQKLENYWGEFCKEYEEA